MKSNQFSPPQYHERGNAARESVRQEVSLEVSDVGHEFLFWPFRAFPKEKSKATPSQRRGSFPLPSQSDSKVFLSQRSISYLREMDLFTGIDHSVAWHAFFPYTERDYQRYYAGYSRGAPRPGGPHFDRHSSATLNWTIIESSLLNEAFFHHQWTEPGVFLPDPRFPRL